MSKHYRTSEKQFSTENELEVISEYEQNSSQIAMLLTVFEGEYFTA